MTAADSAAAPLRTPSDPDAMQLLRGAATAAQTTPYQGTEYLTAWHGGGSTTTTVAVAHVPGDGTVVRSGQAGGAKGGTTGLMFEPDNAQAQPGLGGYTSTMLDLLAHNYTVVRSVTDRVCGRSAQVIEARRADGSAAGRFWIDQTTGIMLHRELLDRHGRTLVAAGFQDLTITSPSSSPSTLLRPTTTLGLATDPWDQILSGSRLDALPGAGPDGTTWKVPRSLPGHLSLYVARETGSGAPVHLGYTDGLLALSVFVQRGMLDTAKLTGWRRTTVHGRAVYERSGRQYWRVWAARGQVYTVVADTAPDNSDAVVAALPQGLGFWQRLDRGLHRVVSWANPFR
jgi:sigma-E factor negative regulatory protein RseB